MLPSGYSFHPLTPLAIDAAADLIAAFDSDDAAEAHAHWNSVGTDGHFVVSTAGGDLAGVTGASFIDDTDNAFWLSWTAVAPELLSGDVGRAMVAELLTMLADEGGRKIFADFCDSDDPTTKPRLAKILQIYESVGLARELVVPDYYAPRENRIVYGLRLADRRADAPPMDDRGAAVTALVEIDEADDVYFVDWRYAEPGQWFTATEIAKWAQTARKRGGRAVYMSFPTTLPEAVSIVQTAGFRPAGRLVDYFEDGVDDIHLSLML